MSTTGRTEHAAAGDARVPAAASARTAATAVVRAAARSRAVTPLSVLVTLGVWQLAGHVVNHVFLATPSEVVRAVPDTVRTGELQHAFVYSMKGLAIGWAAAVAAGVVLGLVRGRFRFIDSLTEAQLAALYSIPSVALIPMFILWFGLGLWSQVGIVFLSAFFPIEINTYSGVRNISETLIEIGAVEGATERQLFRKILLPATVPFVMAGMRLSVGRAVVGMVVAGMFTSISGLGGLVVLYGNQFATARLFVVIIVLAVLGVALTKLVAIVERLVTPWRPE